MAAPLDPAEEVLALLPPDKAALLRARLREPTAAERKAERNRLLRWIWPTYYAHLLASANAAAAVISRDLTNLQPVIRRNGPEQDGDGKRGALARFLRLNDLNSLGPDRIEEILARRRS